MTSLRIVSFGLIQSVHFLGARVNMFIHIAVCVPILWGRISTVSAI